MSLAARSTLVTEAEFLALPESNERIELVDGEVVMSPSSTYRHQLLSKRLVERLSEWIRANDAPHVVLYAPLDIRLAAGRIVQPDIVVFKEALPPDVSMPIDTLPTLCVEVLSTNRVYDRVTKRMLYAAAGIPEYWCVDPAGGVLERFSGENLSVAERHEDRMTTPLLPGLSLDVPSLFQH